LLDIIKKQNRIKAVRESFHTRILERLIKEKANQPRRTGREEGAIIIEIEEKCIS